MADLSLDEYIRRKKAADTVCLLGMREKEREYIDKDELDRNLDEMVEEKARAYKEVQSSLSKFDRIRISEDKEYEDVDMENPSIKFAKEIESMEHPSCCKSKPFQTIEDKKRVKIKSQQWRLNREGAKNHGGGRIQKDYRRNNEIKNINRGSFTFKYRCDEEETGNNGDVVGIVRRNKARFDGGRINKNTNSAPININMNWRGFFEGVSRYSKDIISPPNPPVNMSTADGATANVNLQLSPSDLLEFLKYKKAKAEDGKPMKFAEKYASDARVEDE